MASISSASDSLTVVVSGNYRGRLDGCHCPEGSKGGLAPRATVMKRLFPAGNSLGLDCGGFLDLDPEGGRERSRCSLLGLRHQGLEAAFASLRDLFYGERFLWRLADTADVGLVCANILGVNGKPLFATWRVIERDGWRIVVTGVAEYQEGRRFPGTESWRIVPPDSVLATLRRTKPAQVDLVVMLTDMNEKSLQAFLPRFPEAMLVLTNNRLIDRVSPFRIGSATVIHPKPDGGFVEVARIPPGWRGDKPLDFQSHVLGGSVKPDPETQRWMKGCMGW